MNLSRSLKAVANQLMSNPEMEQLSLHDRQVILVQMKKLYSQQMSRASVEIMKKNQVKANKTGLQLNQQRQIKSIQQNLTKKMTEHNKKREKELKCKVSHFKLLQENWKHKFEEIQRKKKEQNKISLKKAAQYREQIQTFWSQKKKKKKIINIDNTVPVVEMQGYFSIKTEFQAKSNKPIKNNLEVLSITKQKSQSKNQLQTLDKILLPAILSRGQLSHKKLGENHECCKTFQNQSNKNQNKSMQEHIQKSKLINHEKQQFALQKALEKLKLIEAKRNKCKQERQKTIKEAKLKREIKLQSMAKIDQNNQSKSYIKNSTKKRKQKKSVESLRRGSSSLSKSRKNDVSLNQLIIQHKKAKEQLENQKFSERGEILKAKILKQKKKKMLKIAKEAINRIRHEALKQV